MNPRPSSPSVESLPVARPPGVEYIGTAVSLGVIGLWAGHLTWLLASDVPVFSFYAVIAVGIQTFLSTGLFIVAHDAMHGSVAPRWKGLNRAIGQLALLLYALFSMSDLLRAHRVHHRAPGTPEDPDHMGGRAIGYFAWYFRFMRRYLRWYQVVGMAALFNLANHGLGLPAPSLVVFWVVPALASTFQLFTFGTYLPHRIPPGGHRDHHAAESSDFPPWLSLLTCYHFGYHWEHHEFPAVPWWRLPRFRNLRRPAAP